MRGQVFINHLDYYVPQDRLYFEENKDFFNEPHPGVPFDNSDKFFEFVKKYLDIDSVTVEKNLTLEEMVMGLLKKNIEAGKINPAVITHIILAPDLYNHLPSFGHRVQYELNMPKANVVRVTDNFCANIDVGIGLAAKLIAQETDPTTILVIAGTKLGDGFDIRVVGSYGVMGDAAGFMIMSNNKEQAVAEVLGQETVTKGVLYNADLAKDNTILHFQSYSESVKKVLAKAQLTAADVSQVLLHNANQMLVTETLKSCGIKPDKVDKTNHKKYGHLGTVDLVMNLHTNIENAPANQEVLLSVNLGVVGTYVSTLYKKI
jgi:3-oxoacyl-[acyl-carrier-protein] synthase III